jgi:hypothetical protein
MQHQKNFPQAVVVDVAVMAIAILETAQQADVVAVVVAKP